MITEKVYDYIIYSAGPAGIITSLFLSGKGKSVLQLNYYGFTGGSITESLNCLQKYEEGKLEGITSELNENLRNEKYGILMESNDGLVLNPEAVKMVLQEMIKKSQVDLLFHVVPFRTEEDDNKICMQVSGKEGVLNLKTKMVIDCSEDYSLIDLQKDKAPPECLRYNLFMTAPVKEGWSDNNAINQMLQLKDGRYWVSLNIPYDGDDKFIENRTHDVVNKFETAILSNGGRLQLFASQTHRIYKQRGGEIQGKLFHISSLLNDSYNHDEIFPMCSELEYKLGKLL
jgi:hypothetical protein